MRFGTKVFSVFALGLAAGAGCNEVIEEAPTAPLAFVVTDWDPDPSNRVPLSDVRICELDTTNCVETDGDGTAILVLPVVQEIAYTLDKEGYAPTLWPEIIPAQGAIPSEVVMLPDWYVAEEYERVMSPYPMRGTGSIVAQLVFPQLGGTFDLVNASGRAWYLDEDSHWRTDLTATSSRSTGGFTEVTPGVFEVSVGGTVHSCVPALGWPRGVENSVWIPVREGYMSFATWKCALAP